MGRTRTRAKKLSSAPTENTAKVSQQPSVPSLLAKAQSLIVQCDYALAERFIKRILEKEPKNAEAREMYVVVLLETGELEAAKLVRLFDANHTRSALLSKPSQVLESLIPPHEDAPPVPPSSAYLYLAQLSDEDPQAALQYYQKAVDLMTSQLKGKERAVAASNVEDDAEVRRNIVRALIAMVEIWMDPSYDLWCVILYSRRTSSLKNEIMSSVSIHQQRKHARIFYSSLYKQMQETQKPSNPSPPSGFLSNAQTTPSNA